MSEKQQTIAEVMEHNGYRDGDKIPWHKINELFPNGVRFGISAKTMMDNEHYSAWILTPDQMEKQVNTPNQHPLIDDSRSDSQMWNRKEYENIYNDAMASLDEHRKKIFYQYKDGFLTELSIEE